MGSRREFQLLCESRHYLVLELLLKLWVRASLLASVNGASLAAGDLIAVSRDLQCFDGVLRVEVRLHLEELHDVVRLSRDTIRKNDTVWVMKDGLLDIRAVTIAFENEDYAFVSKGIEEGEEIVISQLSRVVPGIELRTEGTEAGQTEEAAAETFSP